MEGGLYKYPMNKYIKDGKVLDHLGLRSKELKAPEIPLIYSPSGQELSRP
jgi:hypothetical protein